MIRLERNLFDGYFVNTFRPIYVANSSKDSSFLTVPVEMKPYTKLLSEHIECVEYSYKKDNYFYDNSDSSSDDVFVAFSGGKDSVAAVIHLIQMGMNPIAYYVRGINRSYPHEKDYAETLAKELGIEFVVKDVSISGKCDYKENPTKNQFVLAMMVDDGVKRGVHKYAFGNIGDDIIDTCSVEYMFSDAYELFVAIEKFYKKKLAKFELLQLIPEEKDSVVTVAGYDSELFLHISSCMDPVRYKETHRKQKESKYGIKLLPGRCGSCYKCAYEAAALTYLGVLDYPEEYISYCEKKLKEWLSILAPGDDSVWLDKEFFKEYAKKHHVKEVAL